MTSYTYPNREFKDVLDRTQSVQLGVREISLISIGYAISLSLIAISQAIFKKTFENTLTNEIVYNIVFICILIAVGVIIDAIVRALTKQPIPDPDQDDEAASKNLLSVAAESQSLPF
jgi:hypothetical protein